ncbi:hypothetical protein [Thermomonospora echinospora]|nr:hypothetical protein [Thermomonospora echinospora]
MTRLLAAVGLGVLIAGTQAQAGQATAKAESPGGSNYFVYRIDGCDREAYGVVNSFDQAPDLIRSQLATMARAGQKRLRIPIFHHRGPDSGTVMDSTGGRLDSSNTRNLQNLLAAVKAAGFDAIEIGFFPLDANDPSEWRAFDRSLYEENRAIIRQVRELTVRASLPSMIDLLNEGSPGEGEHVLLQYTRTLWNDYTREYGTADTVGFSLKVVIADRVPKLPAVYGDRPPDVLEVHLYGKRPNGDEYQQFMAADAAMDRLGYRQPWIIGEAYANDPQAAAGIRRAMADADRPVRYLTQWPLTRAERCPDADVAPPAAYDAYADAGF